MIALVDIGVGVMILACAYLIVVCGIKITKELLKKDD